MSVSIPNSPNPEKCFQYLLIGGETPESSRGGSGKHAAAEKGGGSFSVEHSGSPSSPPHLCGSKSRAFFSSTGTLEGPSSCRSKPKSNGCGLLEAG